MKLAMTNWSMKHPYIVVALAAALAVAFASQFPEVTFDNDPENMLKEDEPVRVLHNEIKEKYALYDFVIAGVVNDTHPDGVFNTNTLNRVYNLTESLLSLKQNAEGIPTAAVPESNGASRRVALDLRPDSLWQRILNFAFRHEPNNLFTEEGKSAIIESEIIAPSRVDNIKQAELGSLQMEYLMEQPPGSRQEALTIRDDALSNPLYKGTLVSGDGQALVVYVPIIEKTYSHNVANLIETLTQSWPDEDKVLITGLPVAEDTFGVEMLIQMAVSAPLAALAVFIILLLFFRRVTLIISPMLVAIVSIVATMGLLIGLGFNVHIMSSMIAIFLMPIAVADSVHILSEFFDTYHRFKDKKQTMQHVIGHLFRPMLYTSLTTAAGFASLAATPIPPVKVFGLHVAFGVILAWLLTMTFIPAYVMLFVPRRKLEMLSNAGNREDGNRSDSWLNRMLEKLGHFSYLHWKAVILTTLLLIAGSAYGISTIRVNDNPVKWFTKGHPIRVADRILNNHFGGTYTAYLTLESTRPDAPGCREKAEALREKARARFANTHPEATRAFTEAVDRQEERFDKLRTSNVSECFVKLVKKAEDIDDKYFGSYRKVSDHILYMQADGLDYDKMINSIKNLEGVSGEEFSAIRKTLDAHRDLTGNKLIDAALDSMDSLSEVSFEEFVYKMEAELSAPLFKRPRILRYVDRLQKHIEGSAVVGKTSSAVDALKKASYELQYMPTNNVPAAKAREIASRNRDNYSVPDTAAGAGQVFTQLEGMKRKDALFHMVTRDYSEANIWVQLKSGDNRDMERVVKDVRSFFENNPAPVKLDHKWAGLTYINIVWQDKMVKGMLNALFSSFVVVLVMMMLLFRSPLFGALSMIPLTVTIAFIYGLIGIVGKDYDMPVAVLSALTLGLSVDFAIHFLERAREIQKRTGSWREASKEMFKEPAMAISRNAITISIGFTPLLFAPLVPYKTVGFFLAMIMAVSWLATLFILPATVTMLQKRLFKKTEDKT
jgi:predicted RND superfamily exporter protein